MYQLVIREREKIGDQSGMKESTTIVSWFATFWFFFFRKSPWKLKSIVDILLCFICPCCLINYDCLIFL